MQKKVSRAKMKFHRNRYIVFCMESSQPITRDEIIKTIKTEGLYLIRFNGKYGMVRCSHREKEKAASFLNSIKSIGTKYISIRTLGTSGTIRAAYRKWFPQ